MKIIVFLGPTLPHTQAKAILPDAQYQPPVQCGDILHLLRDKPDVFVIIDGYFEQTASVWHKEILYALEKGIEVYGASSMGALRAAELHTYGMQGMGKIFEQYRDGILEADDEVAVAHLNQETGYRSLSDAMVNIRATLDSALEQSIINQPDYQKIMSDLKAQHYAKRHLIEYLNQHTGCQAFAQWIKAQGIIDQKQLDAIALLQHLKKLTQQPQVEKQKTPQPMFFRALRHKIQCDKLTIHSKKHKGSQYAQIKRLAALLAVAYQLKNNVKEDVAKQNQFLLPQCDTNKEIIGEINQVINAVDITESDVNKTQYHFSLIDNIDTDNKNTCKYYSAILWTVILKRIERLDCKIIDAEIVQLSNKFRVQKTLQDVEAFEAWLKHTKLSLNDYQDMIQSAYWFDYIVARFNIDILVKQYHENTVWWFDVAKQLAKPEKIRHINAPTSSDTAMVL